MKGIKLLILFFTILAINACSDEIIEPANIKQTNEKSTENLKSGGDGKYDLVGFGYDATGRCYHPSSSRARVINLSAFEVAHPDRITIDNSHCSTVELLTGTDSKDFISKLTRTETANATIKLFTGEVKTAFSTTSKVSSNESYAKVNVNIQYKHISLNAPVELLIQYLSNEFKNDLLTQTPQYIIKRYGTHILSDVILGGRLRVMNKATSTSTNKTGAIEASTSASMLKIFGVTLSGSYDQSLSTTNRNEVLNYETIGGNPGASIIGGTIDPTKGTAIDITSWQTSVNTSNMCLIDVTPRTMISLSDLVSDPSKKLALQNAISAYVTGTDIEQISELYRYYNPGTSDHFYTSKWSELGGGISGWSYNRVEGYVLPSNSTAINAVPLYRYYNPKLRKHFYTTNYAELGSGKYDWYLEWIECKVYKTQMPNTIPLFRYYNHKLGAHVYTTNSRELISGVDNWLLEKIECYVLASI